MKLRNSLAAAVLGASLLTTLPAVVAPNLAAASGGDCPLVPEWEEMGCSGSFSETINWSSGDVGETFDMQQVKIIGKAEKPSRPEVPALPERPPTVPGSSGGASGSSGSGPAMPYSYGRKWMVVQDCLENTSSVPQKFTRNSNYTANYEASTNASAKALDVITVTIGTKINATVIHSTGWEITIPPGQRLGLGVEYQTITYAVPTGSSVELVNVTAPTATVAGVAC
ncbi:DUF6426 family protein [Kitasatospora sp. NPDC048540]|uniref:DUF6426 family protein n=1 Tax=Kitasatospora sp. NPDC048540 TaxID=3155634 RepID=UPI0033DD13B7